MENKVKNTDYQKVVRVENQKLEIAETTFGIIFFVEDSYSLFFIQSFQLPPEKNYPHLECQFPPKITI